MTEKIAFDYKCVTKDEVNDLIFDNYGNEYIYLKRDNSIMIFKKLSDDICYYFDKNGVKIIAAGGKNQVVKLYYKMREEYDGLDEMPDVIRREEDWIL